MYGAVVANAAPEYEERMVKFLTDKFPDNTANNTEVVIHILHALGNTNSSLAVSYITEHLWHTNEAVRLTAVSALRFFVSLAAVQDEFLHVMDTFRSENLINEIIATLQEGCKNQDTIVFSQSLLQALANNTIILGNPDLQMDLIEFLNMLGSPEALDLVESIEKQSDDIARENVVPQTGPLLAPSTPNFLQPVREQMMLGTTPRIVAICGIKRWGKTMGLTNSMLEVLAGHLQVLAEIATSKSLERVSYIHTSLAKKGILLRFL